MLILLNAILFVMSLYDMLFARKEGGDPTKTAVSVESTTYGNPGFRERPPASGESCNLIGLFFKYVQKRYAFGQYIFYRLRVLILKLTDVILLKAFDSVLQFRQKILF